MTSYLISGAAGAIGYRVAETLLQNGAEVLGLDNLNDAYDVRMKEYRLRILQGHQNFKFIKVDITDTEAILGANSSIRNQSYEAIINLAARAGVRSSVDHPRMFIETNVLGTNNLLELCRQTNTRKFLFASTSSIYGANPPYPTPETADSSQPLQPYSASKKGAEVLCHSYHYLYDLDISILRYFTVYGPAGRPDLAHFRFTQWIIEGRPVRVNGNGEQSRGFTYVDDIVNGTIQALNPTGYEIINLGGHEVIRINDLIHLIEELTGKKAIVEYGPIHRADMLTNWADVTKAGKLLGWKPQVDMTEGVRRLVDWYKVEREWASQIKTDH
ncbi:MAG: nucleotide sugar epimerase [Chloroflexi bacterium RBG_16_51_16]|nr:MAG: nucleotide sugar epimerase [Chloroflexi bacterium RBG_16_51_16]